MKEFKSYIIEKLHINKETKTYDWKEDESISFGVLNDCIDKIGKYNKPNNIKKVFSSYMSKEELDKIWKVHWNVCVYVIDEVLDKIMDYTKFELKNPTLKTEISIPELSEYVASDLKDVKYTANHDDSPEDGPESLDWDEDSIFSTFNTVCCKLFDKKLLLEN